MNARLFVSEQSIELRLENGTQYFQSGDESREEFLERAKAETLKNTLEEVEDIKEINAASLAKFNVEQLETALKGAKDTHAEVIQEALTTLKAGLKAAKPVAKKK